MNGGRVKADVVWSVELQLFVAQVDGRALTSLDGVDWSTTPNVGAMLRNKVREIRAAALNCPPKGGEHEYNP